MRTEIVGAQDGMELLREPGRRGREELAHDGAPSTGDGLSAVGPEERLEPPGARDGVVIEEGDDVGVHLGERAVSRAREPETRLAHHAKGRGRVSHAGEDGGGVVSGGVVDDQDLGAVGSTLGDGRFDDAGEELGAIVGADCDGGGDQAAAR